MGRWDLPAEYSVLEEGQAQALSLVVVVVAAVVHLDLVVEEQHLAQEHPTLAEPLSDPDGYRQSLGFEPLVSRAQNL